MSRLRSWLAPSLSLALASGGCSKPEEAAKPAPEAKAGEAPKPEAGKGGSDVATKPPAEPVAKPPVAEGALAAAVASMVEAETSYPAELDPLLDLVPAGSPVLVVVRDVDDLLAVADATLGAVDSPLRSLATAVGGSDAADVTRLLDGHKSLQAGMRGADFAIDKGIVIADVAGEGVVIYGTAKPDALPTLLRSLGAEGDDLPDDCKALDTSPGYAVCASTPETLAKYAPGKEGAAVRTKLGERLGSKEVDRANVLAHIAQDPDPGKHVTFGMATTPGLVHFTVGVPKAPEELGQFLSAGTSPALGLVSPGSGFYWAKLDSAAITSSPAAGEPMVGNVLKTLTGELMLGTLADPAALVIVAGVSDPGPAGGLIGLASLQAGSLPKELPDGSKLEVGTETLSIGGKDTQVLHAKLTPAAEQAAMIAKMGLAPEAWLFSAGGYAGVVLGADKTAVEKVATHSGAGLGSEAVHALPKPLAQGLVDNEVALAMHMPIDGLQSPQLTEAFEKVAAQVPASELPPGMTAAQIMSHARAMISPVSGLSVWMAPPKDRLVVHMALSIIGDPRTEEGKAALAAMTTVAGGGDAGAAWGDVATRYSTSDRHTAYEARAGKRSDGALASAAMLGVLAGVAGAALFTARKVEASPPMMAVPPAVAVPPPVAPR